MSKSVSIRGYFVAWKGVPQMGMWAPDEETLQELIDDHFDGIKQPLRDNPEEWQVIEALIIYGTTHD